MSKPWVIDDELWDRIEPLLPPWPDKAPGPRPVPDRQCLQGVLFVLYTSIGWEDLPQELGFGSGMTCWRRLKRWSDAGVFDQLHRLLLAELNAAGRTTGAPAGTRCWLALVKRLVVYRGPGFWLNVRAIWVGAVARVASLAGAAERSSLCAQAGSPGKTPQPAR
jgi:transposase